VARASRASAREAERLAWWARQPPSLTMPPPPPLPPSAFQLRAAPPTALPPPSVFQPRAAPPPPPPAPLLPPPAPVPGVGLLSGIAFLKGLNWDICREDAARDFGITHPQELLTDSECEVRFKSTTKVAASKRHSSRGNVIYTVGVHNPDHVVLATPESKAEAYFALDVHDAFRKLAHSRLKHIPEKSTARMGFSRDTSGKQPFKFMSVKGLDLLATETSGVSAEAEGLAQCATAKRLVWSKFEAGNAAIRAQESMVPLEGARSATPDRQAEYTAHGRVAAAAFQEFRDASANFVRARFQYRCACRGVAPEGNFFGASTKRSGAESLQRGKKAKKNSPSDDAHNISSSSTNTAVASIDVTLPGEDGIGTPGRWGDGREDEDPDIDFGDGVQEEGEEDS
jgi:hypothetical protein